MTRRARALQGFLTAAVLLAAVPALAPPSGAAKPEPTENPLLWRIAGEKPSWLYGTIHLPDDRVLAFPPAVLEAVDASERFFAETPLDPAAQVAMTEKVMIAGDDTLKDLLPEELYARLDRLFTSKGMPLVVLHKLKVWAITVQVVLLDNIVDFATKQPMDMQLYARAQKAGAEVGGVETLEEQLAAFDSLTTEEQIRKLEQTLDQMERYAEEGRRLMDEIVVAYLEGDEDKLMDVLTQGSEQDESEADRKLMKSLIDDRNLRMADRIVAQLEAAPGKSHFFAVGAAHMPGKKGLLKLLAKRGLKVERAGARE